MRLSITLVLLTLLAAQANTAGFDASRMTWAERCIEQAVERGNIPGAVLLVGRGDDVLYRKAFGHRSIKPEKTPMTVDTVFDLASLTKPVATAASIMLLVERGQLNPSERVATYIPAFAAQNKQDVTVADLLLHRAGLTPDNSIADYVGSTANMLNRIYNLPLLHQPGSKFLYSDVGYIVLGELVRIIDGRPIDQFSRQEIFQPLGMTDTTFNPPDDLKSRCAPTEQRDGRWMIGQVHDPRAYAVGGVAGHAGLFSTADDLSRFCRMILNRGTLDGKRVLADLTVREMIRPRCLPDDSDCRTYGYDVNTSYSSARGSLFDPEYTFGHTGLDRKSVV
jgi:CubicO group peptidase (beta-lactamase class C family)